ncbi:hypothetical protein ACLOJK_026965 [Asimina triloba]
MLFRVVSASVEVDGRTVSEIGPGLLVLVGLHESDVESDADFMCRKVLNMRLFPNDSTGKSWDQNVMQKKYGVLLVSQFTLFGILKGNKPDFHVLPSAEINSEEEDYAMFSHPQKLTEKRRTCANVVLRRPNI